MTKKIIYISENPTFTSFETWLENKLNSVSAEEAASIRQVVAAKQAANPDVDTNTLNKGSSIEIYTNVQTVQVPGFDDIFNQWLNAYDVQILEEEA
jgi:hypothetical protein